MAGPHWSVVSHKRSQTSEHVNLPFRGTVFTKVLSSDPETEKVKVASIVGDHNKPTEFAYAFNSRTGWIRGQPEDGTTMLSVIGADSKEVHAVSYYDPTKSGSVREYVNAANTIRSSPTSPPAKTLGYRPIAPSEVDLASKFAQLFLGYRHHFSARGGLSHLLLSNSSAVVETAQLRVHGPHHVDNEVLNDEIRFGVVRRVTPNTTPSTPALIREGGVVAGLAGVVGGAPPFAKEVSVVLNGRGSPTKLLDHRQGHVIDDRGQPVLHSETRKRLRAIFRWGTESGYTTTEIDEDGNWQMTTPRSAGVGGLVKIPYGHFQMSVGRGMKYTANNDVVFETSQAYRSKSAMGFFIHSQGTGEVKAQSKLDLLSSGLLTIKSDTPAGIHMGRGTKSPILLATPDFVTSYTELMNRLAAWAGAVTAAMVPLAVASLGTSAGAISQGGSLAAAVARHLATILPGQAISLDVLSS